mgnify:CR=1 FL=1
MLTFLFRRHRWIAALVAVVLTISISSSVWAVGRTTTQVRLVFNALGELGVGLSTITDPLDRDFTQLLSTGTGANQASNLYHDDRTLTASASENLDLAGSLTNGFGVTLTFTAIKAMLVRAKSTNTNNVQVGGAASNAWATWVGNSTDIVSVKPGGTLLIIAPDATGFAVTAGTGDILTIANSAGSTSVIYEIILLGVD